MALKLFLGLLGTFAASVLAGILRVPVTRMDESLGDPLGGLMALEADSQLGATNRSGLVQDETLNNYLNMGYYGDIHVGTPGQAMSVIFDTGSSSFWVSTPAAMRKRCYASTISSTYAASDAVFDISYGSGDVSGLFCKDTVAIGALTLRNFTFAEVDNTNGIKNWQNKPYAGILGLGFPSISVGGFPTVMQALVESGQLDAPVFGFYVGNNQPGELVFGGVDPKHITGDFHFVNVTAPGYWAVGLDSIKLGNILTMSATQTAIVDSGTSLLAGPTREVDAIAALLGSSKFNGLHVVHCLPKLPDIVFTLGGREFSLSHEELVVKQVGELCILGIQPIETPQPMWILGDIFMRKYYVQFDWGLKRVGFALSSTGESHRSPNLV